ncbi:MAG: CRISPR-associated helicase Cas3' [Planctomycetota bacterium]
MPGHFAHTFPGKSCGSWQSLEDHLNAVAEICSKFADRFGAADWGHATGLWHDLGKYSCAFQSYLSSTSEPDSHQAETRGSVDHATAGAQHAVKTIPVLGHLIAYVIAGHHSGLLDAISDGANQEKRLAKAIEPWVHGLAKLNTPKSPQLPEFLRRALDQRSCDPKATAFSFAFFTRMLFACLVDADFLDTEAFMSPARAADRPTWPSDILSQISDCTDSHVNDLGARQTPVNRRRQEVRQACIQGAELNPGLFSLSVPTGGGKTLASLTFALRHAVRHGMERVIYVIPFTSIIEQNAAVFRSITASLCGGGLADPVIEHHSSVDVGEETVASRLATENWDAPIIVTTTVQFYESMFANRSRRCRKLHRLAKSVIILDEVQSIPVDYLKPCLSALRELSENYGSSVVLCTATQPAVHHRDEFPIGLKGVREIIPEPTELHQSLERVEVVDIGDQGDSELDLLLAEHRQSLCIVNTRKHARRLFEGLKARQGIFHLSASMCPEHRSSTLREIFTALERGERCQVISTQVIEAGVDVDFPVVFRSLAGLDSIAQAAGRCNRNGELKGLGKTFVFRSEHRSAERFLREMSGAARQILGGLNSRPLYPDLLAPEAIEHYFRLYYWSQKDRWDAHDILARDLLDSNNPKLPFVFGFATTAKNFRFIENCNQAIIIPWRHRGRELCEALRAEYGTPRQSTLRELQRYSVQIPEHQYQRNVGLNIELIQDRYPILTSPELHYDEELGILLDDETPKASFVI